MEENLIETNKELEIVKSKLVLVEEELSKLKGSDAQTVAGPGTYANVVSKNLNLAVLAREVKKEESRWNNFVVSGTKASSVENADDVLVHELANELDISVEGVRIMTKRLGKAQEGSGHQLLLVTVSKDKRNEFLKKAKNLRTKDMWNGVYISPDLSKQERSIQFKLREERRKAQAEFPNKQWIIVRDKVVEKKERNQAG